MRGATRQVATAFHYKITISNESWLHVAALPWSCNMLSVVLQFTQLTNTSTYLCAIFRWSFFCFFVQNWRIPPQNGNLLEELSSGTEESFFPCQLNWLNAQFPLFTLTLGEFACSSLPWFHCVLSSALGLRPKFIHSLTLTHNHYCNSLRSAPNTTPEGILSQCWCSLLLTLTVSVGIYDDAGATRSWLDLSWFVFLVLIPCVVLSLVWPRTRDEIVFA